MKRIAKVIIALVLVLSTLSGCSAFMESLPPMVVEHDDLSLTIPGRFSNMRDDSWPEKLVFFYCYSSLAVSGIREERAAVEAEDPEMTPLKYAEVFAEGVNLTAPVEETDGLITFRHTMENDDGVEFTYLCSAYRSAESYWIIQAFCPTNLLSESEAELMEILRSVEV